ncbi:MAG: formylmethanofuran dehydrogenase subunit A [Synergistaceae bacterium]|jgi:formylmethanofuran dehydrogenase subunit A|nr:formylmethanofuran dehydrogenase subunit A [Synergistaceae bacterium]
MSQADSGKTLGVINGRLYDPENGVDGEERDVWIRGGVVVGRSSLSEDEIGRAEIIDASGCWVLPGGVDLHAHIAGKANTGRKLCPNDHREHLFARRGTIRAGSGFTTPTTHITAYLYAQMGYTTAVEAASSPIGARHAHEEFEDMPIIDKAMLIVFGNNEFVLESLAKGEPEIARDYISWILEAVGGYGIKAVNPGGVDNWKWGGNIHDIDDNLKSYDTTPRKIISFLAETADSLGVPHPLHLHGLNLGAPESAATTIATMDAFEGRRGHLCHLQFLGYEPPKRGSGLASGAIALTEALKRYPNLTVDVGQIIFGQATTMTSDAPLEYHIHQLTGKKWVSADMENEAGSGVVPLEYKPKSRGGAAQWVTGMELFMLMDDPWRLCLTTDHPNAGPFFCYPQVIKMLTDGAYRREALSSINAAVAKRSVLNDIDREYSLYDIAIITRAAPARILGLPRKGHLGVGADGDVAVYRPSRQGQRACRCPNSSRCSRMLDLAEWTIKGGEVVVRDGLVVKETDGDIFTVSPGWDPAVEDRIREYFRNYYSVSYENYAISGLHNRKVIPCGTIGALTAV